MNLESNNSTRDNPHQVAGLKVNQMSSIDEPEYELKTISASNSKHSLLPKIKVVKPQNPFSRKKGSKKAKNLSKLKLGD